MTSTVPTAAERTGDFSQFLQTNNVLGTNPCDGTPVYYGQIFDPSTARVVNGRPCRTAFPGNIIPPGKISPVATNILKYYPAPQNSDIVNNYTLNSPYPINNTTYTIRIDEKFRRSTIYGSYSTRENTSLKASRTLPDPVDPNQWAQDFITHFGRFGWDYGFLAKPPQPPEPGNQSQQLEERHCGRAGQHQLLVATRYHQYRFH